MIRHLFTLVALLIATPLAAQTVVLTSPTTTGPGGQPRSVLDVFVRNADGSIANDVGGTAAATVATSAASAGIVAKASAGYLYGVNVTTAATGGYLLVHYAGAIPADGAVAPAKCIAVAPNTSVAIEWRASPLYSANGFAISFSSTGCFTKTASATAFISADVR